MSSRTFIVSNRLPLTLAARPDGGHDVKRSSGGLVSGLGDVQQREDAFWVGHAGIFSEHEQYSKIAAELLEKRFICVPIPKDEYEGYYTGVANGALWPLFHYFPESMRFKHDQWLQYVAANLRFADAVLEHARPGDRVWVHDYQLMLVPGMLRQRLPSLKIAYFHHIPFPSSEIFRILPPRNEILQGLLGADLVGFHTLDYTRHFLTGVSRILGGDVDRDEIRFQRRLVKVGAFPLGVDVASLRDHVLHPEAVPGMEELGASLAGKSVLLGIDRLDYTKGIPERLLAFQKMLRRYPEIVGKVAFVQVCVPSREHAPGYGELRAEVERLVGQINGEFGRPGYVPLQYLYQPFTPEQVVAFYKLGDVMLVTPLRDGLNLVCKEFVASRSDDDGVLVLSEFAGAAAEMGEALLVNPFDIDRLAETMMTAVNLPVAERQRRMRLLRKRVASYNNIEWAKDFMLAWDEATPDGVGRGAKLEGVVADDFVERLVSAPRRRLFLDYDGTLTPIRRTPSLATPSPELLKILRSLTSRQDVDVTIITGRSREFCDQYLGDLGATLVAEHCAFYRRRGDEEWQAAFSSEEFERVRAVVKPHLDDYVRRIPGAFVEEKETSLVLHYREAEPIFAHTQALDLKESLQQILGHSPYAAFKAKKAIEIKPAAANKSTAVELLLSESGHLEEPFLTAGDDLVDEDMFRVREGRNLSIHVGHHSSHAKFVLEGPSELLSLLQKVADELDDKKGMKHVAREIGKSAWDDRVGGAGGSIG